MFSFRYALPILLLLSSCGSSHNSLRNKRYNSARSSYKKKNTTAHKKATLKNSVTPISAKGKVSEFIADWKGTPYRYGGTSRSGIDCSAFAGKYYASIFGLSLKRTTKLQYQQGRFIRKSNLKHGDLVFFKNSRKAAKVDHVGVYLGNNRFIHASTSRGVTISDLSSNYYQKRYVGAKRLF